MGGCTSRCAKGVVTSIQPVFLADAYCGDAQVIELEPSSHVGFQLKHLALHGVQHYGEAVEAFQIMLAKLDSACGMQI
jgi:hypothetical protein